MNHGLTLIVSLFYPVQTSFKESGEVEVGLSKYTYIRIYKVFTKTGQGPWLRGDCLGPAGNNKLHSTMCIVLLSEFVSWNAWLQQ